MTVLLEATDLCAFYGQTQALHGIGITVAPRGVTAVLGANGAGKTTTLKAVCGLVDRRGTIRFDGARIDGWPTAKIVRSGIAHVPEGRGTFVNLTVEENLRLGAYTRRDKAVLAADYERIYHYFPVLAERRRQQAGTMSGGEQQMLAIGRALMLRPRLLVLDEPSFGLAPKIVQAIFGILAAITAEQRVGLLLVEQNAALALDLADRIYLLETGRVVLSGRSDDLKRDQSIRRAYLGY
ncbi:MAG: ABC transporter ATP-binding protein [Alphaproteobacteria bacterium]|nr:ABC transporter ATP-binding protein [Alphaproteobacteria bacterium]